MRIEQVYGSQGGLTHETRITIEDVDVIQSRDSDLWFWKLMDNAARELGVKPFCPCMQRPHRIFCPLGFDNYFPGREEAAPPAKHVG